ncbi:sensor histidine kinase [Paenibacillus wulumuqiensis]|uniref:sensor histidine kinase n=1 Tax=Paenibacillus wulumuqiensis TaxID=1567107 RepID=UPI00061932F8|nr:ATP-binding protein [Paenibacillus wulumuqiensis]
MENSHLIRSIKYVGILWVAIVPIFIFSHMQYAYSAYSHVFFTVMLVGIFIAFVLIWKEKKSTSCPELSGQRLLQFAGKCQHAATAVEIINLLKDEMKEIMSEQDIFISVYDKQQNNFNGLPLFFERKSLESLTPGQWKYADDYWIISVGEGLQEHYYLYSVGKKVALPDVATEKYFTLLACHVQLLLHNQLLVHSNVDKLIHTHASSIHSSPLVAQMLFSIAEAERKKLSHDIHDYLIQEMIHMNRIIEHHRNVHPDIQQLHNQMQHNIGYLRDCCFDLSPPFLQQLRLVESLNLLVDQHRNQNRCEIELICRINIEDSFSEVFNINIYRIAQELLNNAAKHAQAQYIILSLLQKEDRIILVYEDNGVGIDWDKVNKQKTHFGLTGIKERIKSMNGTYAIVSNINEGLLFKCEFLSESYTS